MTRASDPVALARKHGIEAVLRRVGHEILRGPACVMCERTKSKVRFLVGRERFICDECVAEAATLLRAEGIEL